MIYIFWILLFLVFYSYAVYPVMLYVFGYLFGRNRQKLQSADNEQLPEITLLVTAFNERDFVDEKIRNSKKLKYPSDKLTLLWVTDGSDDGTPEKVAAYPQVKLMHEDARRGKIHAMNRAAQAVDSDIIVFCDANTFLTEDTLINIARHFQDPKIGCVAGEKQIIDSNSAAGAGEGAYWKYESTIKKLDYRFNTTLGAAGELFAVRKNLYEPVESDTVLDDFIISLRIAAQGYAVAYEPGAIAREFPSYSVSEEMKRKVRIAAGGFQSLKRLSFLLNPLKYPRLAFQFISHKVFRWLICPLALLVLIPVNVAVVWFNPDNLLYVILAIAHLLVYITALSGWILEKQKFPSVFYLPYYFVTTNIAQIRGLARYLKKSQSVNWERAKRAR